VVEQRVSAVSYKTAEEEGRKRSRVVHINNSKDFKEKELERCALTVIAEEGEADECRGALRVEQCAGFKEEEIDKVLTEFSGVMSDVPGKMDVVKMRIELEEGTSVISQMPYRLPDRLKQAVEEELDDLIQSEIIEPPDSRWASSLVPVAKPKATLNCAWTIEG